MSAASASHARARAPRGTRYKPGHSSDHGRDEKRDEERVRGDVAVGEDERDQRLGDEQRNRGDPAPPSQVRRWPSVDLTFAGKASEEGLSERGDRQSNGGCQSGCERVEADVLARRPDADQHDVHVVGANAEQSTKIDVEPVFSRVVEDSSDSAADVRKDRSQKHCDDDRRQHQCNRAEHGRAGVAQGARGEIARSMTMNTAWKTTDP